MVSIAASNVTDGFAETVESIYGIAPDLWAGGFRVLADKQANMVPITADLPSGYKGGLLGGVAGKRRKPS